MADSITACEWRVGAPSVEEVRIVERAQRDGSILFAVKWLSYVANKDGEWEYEPLPSSRTDEFVRRARWSSWQAAAEVAARMARDPGARPRAKAA